MTIPKSAREFFNQQLPEALVKNANKVKDLGPVTYKFEIQGDGGGLWTVDLSSTSPTCTPGEKAGSPPMCTVEIAHEDFMRVFENPTFAMQLYFQGKLRVTGDPMLATKLQQLFSVL